MEENNENTKTSSKKNENQTLNYNYSSCFSNNGKGQTNYENNFYGIPSHSNGNNNGKKSYFI